MHLVSLWDEDRTTFRTPEEIDLHLQVANAGSRGLAMLIDVSIRYGVLLLLYIVFALSREMAGLGPWFEMGRQGFFILMSVLFFGSEWLYFTLFEWLWNGQTPGKRWLRLRVIKEDGSPTSVLEVVARNLTRPLDTAGPMALIGLGFIFLHPRRQRPGDLLGRTLVIQETPINWDIFELPSDRLEGQQGRVILSPLQLEILQRYRQRADKLEGKFREEVASQVRAALQDPVRGTDLEHSTLDAVAWIEELAGRL